MEQENACEISYSAYMYTNMYIHVCTMSCTYTIRTIESAQRGWHSIYSTCTSTILRLIQAYNESFSVTPVNSRLQILIYSQSSNAPPHHLFVYTILYTHRDFPVLLGEGESVLEAGYLVLECLQLWLLPAHTAHLLQLLQVAATLTLQSIYLLNHA